MDQRLSPPRNGRMRRIDWQALLKQYRFSHNIKQSALADDLGVTQAMVSRWETGLATPGADMRARIRRLTEQDSMSAPVFHWRDHVAAHPAIAAVVEPDGRIEIASHGLAKLLGSSRRALQSKTLAHLFRGDIPRLHSHLLDSGFFDEALESVESADTYCFVNPEGELQRRHVHGLHWPGRDHEGRVRWMLRGALVDANTFERLRKELGGQLRLTAAS